MTYLTQAEIANNMAMQSRIAQCAAEQEIPSPDQWAQQTKREWAAAPNWDDAWASALVTNAYNITYDPGKDEAVITDLMILAQVQAMKAEPAP